MKTSVINFTASIYSLRNPSHSLFYTLTIKQTTDHRLAVVNVNLSLTTKMRERIGCSQPSSSSTTEKRPLLNIVLPQSSSNRPVLRTPDLSQVVAPSFWSFDTGSSGPWTLERLLTPSVITDQFCEQYAPVYCQAGDNVSTVDLKDGVGVSIDQGVSVMTGPFDVSAIGSFTI